MKTSHLNSAGEALRALGLGSVRLRYREADSMITRDTFSLWLDDADEVGCGDTPEEALNDLRGKLIKRAA